jgi:hypothetical protein
MRRINGLYAILFITLMIFSSPINSEHDSDPDEDIAPPELIRVLVDDSEITELRVPVNSTVKLEYNADRFNTDGLLLLGTGSNLTLSIQVAFDNNYSFTLDRARVDKKYFSIEFNVTENTKFFAYTWHGELTEGIYEDIDKIDKLDGRGTHQIFVTTDTNVPVINSVLNATSVGTNSYVTTNTSLVSIRYNVQSTKNDTRDQWASIVFADNSTNILEESYSEAQNMTYLGFDNNIHSFEYNMTLTDKRVTFFTAFNRAGFERDGNGNPIAHRLALEFLFNSTYQNFAVDDFTDLDIINFNVTSYNQTDNDQFYLRYRQGNSTETLNEANFTDFKLSIFEGPVIRNATINNSTETVYHFVFNSTFNASQYVEIQVYVRYFNLTEHLPSITLQIVDSRPTVEFFNQNITITNKVEFTAYFKAITEKGELTAATISWGLNETDTFNATVNVLNRPNIDTRTNQTFTTINLEGIYVLQLNVTNNLNRSRTSIIYLQIDLTLPTGSIEVLSITPSSGRVVLNVEYEDLQSNYSRVIISWGNGLVQDITDLHTLNHIYSRAGTYIINMTVWDKAGNAASFDIEVEITIPPRTQPTISGALFFVPSMIFGFLLILFFKRRMK